MSGWDTVTVREISEGAAFFQTKAKEWERRRQKSKGRWKEIKMKEKKILKKKKELMWKILGIIFHSTSTNHQGSLTTGLPVGQDC